MGECQGDAPGKKGEKAPGKAPFMREEKSSWAVEKGS